MVLLSDISDKRGFLRALRHFVENTMAYSNVLIVKSSES